jgi:hypothetical protein
MQQVHVFVAKPPLDRARLTTEMTANMIRLCEFGGRIMRINGVKIDDTYAEGFHMSARGFDYRGHAGVGAGGRAKGDGFATSIIACGCEADIESTLPQGRTDGRDCDRHYEHEPQARRRANACARRQCV